MARMSGTEPDSTLLPFGALAQLGERLICIQEVRSSILLGSTKQQFAVQVGGKDRVGSSGG
jgi:hypothetical protein